MADPGKNYITPDGFRRLSEEAHHLRTVERKRVVEEVAHAASLGDRSENAEYIYGKKKLREIDRRLEWLGKRLDAAVVVNPRDKRGDARIFFGATVVVEDEEGEEKTVMLVGEDEIDAGAGRISWRSPVGSALLTRREGDEVRVRTPAGTRTLTVIEVKYE
ncbi:MAG TPA: transcription elongation factor GreB [Haliangiales bacterium]|nr:transcription elongation factor GreB [Haliangiales bacterium]